MPRAEPGTSRRSRCSGVWPGVWTAVGLAGRERGRAAHVLSMVSIRGRVGSWEFGAVDLKDHA